MAITIAVFYPNDAGSKFDMDYYLGTHCPLVKDKWGSAGLNSLNVIKGIATADPSRPPPYQIIAILSFESLEAFQGAVSRPWKQRP